jgi:hypothetical protein
MRMIFVVITGLMLITLITFTWYVFQPLAYQTISLSETILNLFGLSPEQMQLATQNNAMLYWFNLLWGPLADIFVMLWMVVSAGRMEVRSEIYG